MTVKELKEMIKNMNDNEEIRFVQKANDRDGWLYYRVVRVDRVETEKKRA